MFFINVFIYPLSLGKLFEPATLRLQYCQLFIVLQVQAHQEERASSTKLFSRVCHGLILTTNWDNKLEGSLLKGLPTIIVAWSDDNLVPLDVGWIPSSASISRSNLGNSTMGIGICN